MEMKEAGKTCNMDCQCCTAGGGCGGWSMWGGRRHWGYIVLKILVALFVFWAGMKFGELKALVRAQYPGYGGGYGWPSMMMYRY